MTPSSDDKQALHGATGGNATEADIAGVVSQAVDSGLAAATGQPSQRDDDAGLASTGEALNAGQAPQVGPDKETVDPAGAAGRGSGG